MWVVVILAGLVGFIIFVLCVPIDVVLKLNTSERPLFRSRVVWLFGLISRDLSREKKKPEKGKLPEEKPKRKSRIRFATVLKILRTKGLFKQIKNLIKRILHQFQIRELVADLRLGLDEPADTGLLFAAIGSATPFISFSPRYQVRVQPSFDGEAAFEGYLHGTLRLQPIRLVLPLLRFIFSLAVLRVVKILVVSKWRRQE